MLRKTPPFSQGCRSHRAIDGETVERKPDEWRVRIGIIAELAEQGNGLLLMVILAHGVVSDIATTLHWRGVSKRVVHAVSFKDDGILMPDFLVVERLNVLGVVDGVPFYQAADVSKWRGCLCARLCLKTACGDVKRR